MMTLNIFLGAIHVGVLLAILITILVLGITIWIVKIVNKTVKGKSLIQLGKLHELKQKGIITEDEFNDKKSEIMKT